MKPTSKQSIFRIIPLWVICMFVLHCTQIRAQEYIPMLSETAVWNYQHGTSCQPFTPIAFSYSVFLNGDTLINGQNYFKAYRPHREWVFGDDSFCTEGALLPLGYIGSLREDTEERKVYFVPPGLDEVLLYDYTLQEGDPLNDFMNAAFEWPVSVVAVDEIQIDGMPHKRWIIDEDNNLYIIEGIGSSFGLLAFFPFGLLDGAASNLLCWSNESALYTTNGEFQDCQLITSVSSGQFSDETINLYPNPAHGMVRLEVPADWGSSDVAIEIISSSGQMVYSHAATSLPTTWIDLQGLPPGMYLVRVHAQNRTYVRKLVLR